MTAGGRTTAVALRALVASPVVLAAATVVLGLATPGYDIGRETVSALGAPGRPWAWATRLVLAAYGAVVVAASPGWSTRLAEHRRLLVVCIAAFGVGSFVAGCFAKPMLGEPPTTSGSVHVVAALVGTACLLVAMYLVARRAVRRAERVAALVAGVVVLVGSVAFRQSWGTVWYGAAERIVLLAATGWLALEAWWRLRPRPGAPGGDR